MNDTNERSHPTTTTTRPRKSKCCLAPETTKGACSWCGEGFVDSGGGYVDDLHRELVQLLCDWNAPRQMQDHDLDANISKVYQFIKRLSAVPSTEGAEQAPSSDDRSAER